ncbi:porin [Paraburkholderia sp. JHI869]|uniref:porin n=1 Tax=Paraburkholderia sp. JHI869 TaxID=3112959 RepID=UPI00317FCCB8
MKGEFMKRRSAALSVVVAASCAGFAVSAHAQSSVTLDGVVDAGIDYVSNIGGKSQVSMGTGILAPNLFGLHGKEDLGGGLAATFVLQGQYNLGTGASIGGLYSYQSYLGLTDDKWGSLTAGNQYDFMFTSLAVKRYGPAFPYISILNLRNGPFNGLGVPNQPTGAFDFDRLSGQRVTNSLKYESPNLSGFSFGALYGFGGVAGSFSQNSSQSFSLDYSGKLFNLDAAYTYVRYPTINNGNSGIRNFGVGGGLFLGPAYLDALFTNTRNTFSGAVVNVYEIGGMYPFSPFLHLAAAYQFMDGNSVLNNNRAHQVNATLVYSLSKRTDVYTAFAYQHAVGNGALAQIILYGPSDSRNQLTFRIGMRHVF